MKSFLNLSFLLILIMGPSVFTGCHTPSASYAPAPRLAQVQSVEVLITEFHGRPDVVAVIKGRLSSNAAQLVDVEQSRSKNGNELILNVYEQTPKGGISTNRVPNPPFQTRVPLETLCLVPGQTYIVNANGFQSSFQMPGPPAQMSYADGFPSGFELPSY